MTFTATVTADPPGAGTPTGTVTFQDGGVDIAGCVNQALLAGSATCAVTYAGAGSHSITAIYNGDADFNPSTSAPIIQTVDRDPTTTSLNSSVNPSVAGRRVTFTATVTASPPGSGTPTGTVTFQDGGVNIAGCVNQALVAGIATCNTTFAVVGSHSVTAVYTGDPNFLTSTSVSVTELILPGLPNTSGLQTGPDAATPIPPEGIPSPWPTVLVLIASLGGLAILAGWLMCNRVRFRQRRRHRAVGAIVILCCFVIGTIAGSQLITRPLAGSAPSRPPTAVAGLPADTEQIGSKIVTVAKPPPSAAQSFHPATGPILPSRLRIPSIGVDAPVVGVGLLRDGSMDAPDNLWTAAWLSSGARPGQSGSSVLAGHRGIGAPAVFSHLENVRPGERVFVSDAAAGQLVYEVTEVVSIDLSPSAQVEVFGPTPSQRLVLITCFGKYLPSARTYDHRLVVVARLLPSAL